MKIRSYYSKPRRMGQVGRPLSSDLGAFFGAPIRRGRPAFFV
ncbi:MAG: hypothetical protein HSCHL_2012 [Hydrogenibacillus schlegelii]|uniref:Uncharacterized protein n=1 Tax=Hydrogenibacillus schlegelii TaxID=1484 RepID=A0A2T5GBE8_HYDSH|nr:MAG: hypothetical protein HSCHL_2012 [Hydrogenibacillus schlegelii]